MRNDKRILLVDPTSIHHGPPDSILDSDNFINEKYVNKINEIVDSRYRDNKSKALHSKYISNYGLLMLSTLLKKDYINIDYINGDYFDSTNNYINKIAQIINKYDLVALTSTTPQFCEISAIARVIKTINPNVKVILGGPHSRYYLTHNVEDYFDCVIIGYGIDKSKEVIDKLLNGEKVRKKIVTDYYYDVKKDFSIIPKDKINDTMLYSYINFGCPNDCKYCVEHKFVDKIAFNCTTQKFNEIKELVKEYGVRFLHIADSDFLLHRATVDKFIDFIEREKLNFCFSVNTSPIVFNKYKNDDALTKLVDVGLVEILIGAEHFSPKVLKSMSKVYNVNEFIEMLDYGKNVAKIPIISLYTLVGFPGEYEEDIKINLETIKKIKKLKLFDFTFPKFFVPYPDSDIYLYPEKYDVIIKNENWDEYQRWQLPRPIEINGMSDQQYVDEIIEINNMCIEEDQNENNCGPSLCKKRK